jgi:hypothetical protein
MHSLKENSFALKSDIQFSVQRLIAIWALSEAALGGLLHALRIPLTGIFINGTAVIIIALISYYTNKKGTILKATLIVLLVKAAVSPHTPLNAYLAVSLQGLIGEIVFGNKKYFRTSALIFGVVTLFLSGIQKIIVLTILFGENLWESIDLFANYILDQIPFLINGVANYEVSFWIIALYVGLHIFVGIIIGLFAGKTPEWLSNYEKNIILSLNQDTAFNQYKNLKKNKRKFWFKKPSTVAILILVIMIILLAYVFPQFSETAALKAIIMVIRSIIIMIIWYLLAGPFFLKLYKNYINKHGSKFSRDVNSTILILPATKSIVAYSWKYSKKYGNFKRLKYFILTTLINILVLELPEDEKNISVNRTQK